MSLSHPQEAPTAGGPTPLGPDSLVWKMGFPRTGLLVAGRALMLQTAHPVVGAGVRDFSDFTRDPWGRLDRTLRSLQVQLFGGPAALGEAERLRRLHRGIRGTGFGASTTGHSTPRRTPGSISPTSTPFWPARGGSGPPSPVTRGSSCTPSGGRPASSSASATTTCRPASTPSAPTCATW